MLDFRSQLMSLLPLEVWTTVEAWEFGAIILLGLWQLAYDGKFSLRGWSGNRVGRIGIILQIVMSLAGVGDAYKCREPHVLFICYAAGTLMIQLSLFVKWVASGRPNELH